jgi:hypothetical protein
MLGEISRPFKSIALVAAVLISGMGVTFPARADGCLAAPHSAAPQGSHWYYRLDWATQRKCWYVRALGQPVQQVVASVRVKPVPSLPAGAGSSRAADAPMSSNPGDDIPSSPHVTVLAVKPTSAEITATVGELGQRNAQDKNAKPSMTEAPAREASPSQADAPPVAPVAWPDAPPAIAAVRVQTPATASVDTPADEVSAGARRTDRGARSVNNDAIPIIIFPILGLGLTAVGVLCMKIAAARRARGAVNQAGLGMVATLPRHEECDDYGQHGSVDKRPEYESLISAISDPPRAESDANQFTPEINKRKDKLAQLHQHLDRLLQSPTPA